jgi:hypothetical protein
VTPQRAAEIKNGEPLNTNDMDIFSNRLHEMFPEVAGLKHIVTGCRSSSGSSSSSSSSSSSRPTRLSSLQLLAIGGSPRLMQIIFGGLACICV